MVASLGMSSRLGNMEYISRWKSLSSETRALVEAEVQRTLNESYERARVLLLAHRKELDLLAKALMEYETLSKEEVEKVIRGEPLPDRIKVPPGPLTITLPQKPPFASDEGASAPVPGEDDGPPPPPPAPPAGVASDKTR